MDWTEHFIFSAGEWLGQGALSFNDSPEKMHYYTKWLIYPHASGGFYAEQRIEREHLESEVLRNFFHFFPLTEQRFRVILESPFLGTIEGQGMVDEERLVWSFLKPQPYEGSEGFSGFEEYLLQDDHSYMLSGEYTSGDHITKINGKIWKKAE